MELIDKAAVVAEIEKHKVTAKPSYYGCGRLSVCEDLIKFLDTLEVKEVDLEKECNNWRHNHFHGRRDKEASGEYLERCTQLDLAKHFFELGLKINKGE